MACVTLVIGPLGCVSERSSGPRVDLEGCNVELPPEAFGSTIVVIRDFNFSPSQVSVAPGSKVTWVNCEPAGSESHTSTADAGSWSSSLLAPGSTFTRQFDAAGAYPYHCEPHPGMRGSVTIQ
jgi:plastocyanin